MRSAFLTAILLFPAICNFADTAPAHGQDQGQKPKPAAAPFRWVNELRISLPGLQHGTFVSPSMKTDVGYCIYLPPDYQTSAKRYPVVYYLHGGRPGDETKSIRMARTFHKHIASGAVKPMIYVFVNGGPVSHYNMPNRSEAQGADVFIRELIPHIDATYRTIADRRGRAIEGFSQGGRGTTRLMFRYPELFCSASPGGAGQETEKRISADNGRESDSLVFAAGDNTYDLARQYAAHPEPSVKILIHVGTKGFNYQNNLQYMKFLESLNIPFETVVVEGATHSAAEIYEVSGLQIMQFHAGNLAHDK